MSGIELVRAMPFCPSQASLTHEVQLDANATGLLCDYVVLICQGFTTPSTLQMYSKGVPQSGGVSLSRPGIVSESLVTFGNEGYVTTIWRPEKPSRR